MSGRAAVPDRIGVCSFQTLPLGTHYIACFQVSPRSEFTAEAMLQGVSMYLCITRCK
jgi:hypothetical protein